ncbi:hypothetical protein PVAP13_4KG122700 [Panicum virgatum]|uniref:Uncharacterized protein n=1 Tax=Panicum virgatum TaxID=38727 RepID=A0A8T0TRR6_PANVG|nr:hypothetical protein PVAP13_4KG122700 [Panicum virgatum]
MRDHSSRLLSTSGCYDTGNNRGPLRGTQAIRTPSPMRMPPRCRRGVDGRTHDLRQRALSTAPPSPERRPPSPPPSSLRPLPPSSLPSRVGTAVLADHRTAVVPAESRAARDAWPARWTERTPAAGARDKPRGYRRCSSSRHPRITSLQRLQLQGRRCLTGLESGDRWWTRATAMCQLPQPQVPAMMAAITCILM